MMTLMRFNHPSSRTSMTGNANRRYPDAKAKEVQVEMQEV
jgi:hypothetical protein